MKLSLSQLEAYHRGGYVIVDCPFPQTLTLNCLKAVEKVAVDPALVAEDTRRNHFRLEPQIPGSYWCALDHALPFLQIMLHPEILEMARQLAGDDDIYLRNGGINELAPDHSFWWHRDSEMVYTEFMHYFSGASVAQGCLRVIPGSHIGAADSFKEEAERRRREQGFPEEYWVEGLADVELPGEIPLEVRPDQLIVRDSRIFHATGLNTSSNGRSMSHWLFRDGASNDHRFRFEDVLTDDLIEALTPEQRDALWLGRDFEIAEGYREEREREDGKVAWGVV